MDILSNLKKLLGIQDGQRRPEQLAVGQPQTQRTIGRLPQQVQQQAQIYEQNPDDPRVAGADPALFGYAEDDGISAYAGSPALQQNQVIRQAPNTSQLLGSVNPVWQQQQGQTPYGLQGFTSPLERLTRRR